MAKKDKMAKFDPDIFMSAMRHEAGESLPQTVSPALLLRLMSMQGELFVREAYSIFLHRKPDKSGLATYAHQAKSIRGRLKLLLVFYLAPERVCLPVWQRLLLEKTIWLVKFKWLK